jgi:hypothetical protein
MPLKFSGFILKSWVWVTIAVLAGICLLSLQAMPFGDKSPIWQKFRETPNPFIEVIEYFLFCKISTISFVNKL